MTSPIVPISPSLRTSQSFLGRHGQWELPWFSWRHAFRQAVTDVAAKAKRYLPRATAALTLPSRWCSLAT